MLDEWATRKLAAWRRGLSNGVLQTTFLTVLSGGLVLYSVWEWSHGRMTPGDACIFFLMTGIVNSYMRDFGAQLRQLQNNLNDLDPVAAYMNMVPAIRDVAGATPLQVPKGDIRFSNVLFQYKQDLPPLFDHTVGAYQCGGNRGPCRAVGFRQNQFRETGAAPA